MLVTRRTTVLDVGVGLTSPPHGTFEPELDVRGFDASKDLIIGGNVDLTGGYGQP